MNLERRKAVLQLSLTMNRTARKIILHPVFLVIFSYIAATISLVPAILLVRAHVIHNIFTLQWTVALGALACTVGIPVLYIRHILKSDISKFGLRLPASGTLTKRNIIVAAVLITILAFLLGRVSSLQNYYAGTATARAFIISTGAAAIAYFSEEFLFRGFMQSALWERFRWNTLWIINIPFVFLHLGKPVIEVVLSVFVGPLLNYIAQKTSSMIPTFLIHFSLSIMLNFLTTFIYTPAVINGIHF